MRNLLYKVDTNFFETPFNTFEQAGHFCQEDIPEILVPLIYQFIQANP